jgi:hypothetical protein
MLVCSGASAQPSLEGTAEPVRGAVYIPSGAYNAPQMWREFDPREVDRDLGYAQKIHLNALRIWASYEDWQENPAKFQTDFDACLAIAQRHGLRILVSLFENDGVEPSAEAMWTKDPAKAFAIRSPGTEVAMGGEQGWQAPRRFVTWFMQHYRDDKRLIAIEVMNEPRRVAGADPATMPFAKAMLAAAVALHGRVPLTMGTQDIAEVEDYRPGIDLIEFHENFPRQAGDMARAVDKAVALGKSLNMPVWLTEWQRTRPGGPGWTKGTMAAGERGIDYASLTAAIEGRPIGAFFWTLMVKRAYLPGQRRNGTVNGLFWPDGSVLSQKDARAIARDPGLALPETALPADFGNEAVIKPF